MLPFSQWRPERSRAFSGPSLWYPSMTFLYKQQRPWADAFAEARSYLEQMMSATLATLLLSLQPLIDAAI
jgi:hypothetical protein